MHDTLMLSASGVSFFEEVKLSLTKFYWVGKKNVLVCVGCDTGWPPSKFCC